MTREELALALAPAVGVRGEGSTAAGTTVATPPGTASRRWKPQAAQASAPWISGDPPSSGEEGGERRGGRVVEAEAETEG
jgi:hypothetical protein